MLWPLWRGVVWGVCVCAHALNCLCMRRNQPLHVDLQRGKQNFMKGASLVVQWLRIHLPMQGTWVQALAREDPTCCGATEPVSHSYCACALQPTSHNYCSLSATTTEPAL